MTKIFLQAVMLCVLNVTAITLCAAPAKHVKDRFNIRDYGAKGDGRALDSKA